MSFLQPQDVIFCGNRVFADVTSEDVVTLEQVALIQCCVLRRTGNFGPRHTQTRRPCDGRVMAEAEPGEMGPQAKALLAQPEEAGRLSPLPRAFTQAA